MSRLSSLALAALLLAPTAETKEAREPLFSMFTSVICLEIADSVAKVATPTAE